MTVAETGTLSRIQQSAFPEVGQLVEVRRRQWVVSDTALNEAADRGVKIRMLLEESKGDAGKMLDAAPRAKVFIWPEESKLENGSPTTASVHAKCVVADGEEALITSANLTDYALEKNMELGVHIIGGRGAKVLAVHLAALISTIRIEVFG
jgi:cardiolipin synthase A/B